MLVNETILNRKYFCATDLIFFVRLRLNISTPHGNCITIYKKIPPPIFILTNLATQAFYQLRWLRPMAGWADFRRMDVLFS